LQTTFSNNYFTLLLEEKWTPKKTHKGNKWTGPLQVSHSLTQLSRHVMQHADS
jgi:cytochrome c peroxidase